MGQTLFDRSLLRFGKYNESRLRTAQQPAPKTQTNPKRDSKYPLPKIAQDGMHVDIYLKNMPDLLSLLGAVGDWRANIATAGILVGVNDRPSGQWAEHFLRELKGKIDPRFVPTLMKLLNAESVPPHPVPVGVDMRHPATEAEKTVLRKAGLHQPNRQVPNYTGRVHWRDIPSLAMLPGVIDVHARGKGHPVVDGDHDKTS